MRSGRFYLLTILVLQKKKSAASTYTRGSWRIPFVGIEPTLIGTWRSCARTLCLWHINYPYTPPVMRSSSFVTLFFVCAGIAPFANGSAPEVAPANDKQEIQSREFSDKAGDTRSAPVRTTGSTEPGNVQPAGTSPVDGAVGRLPVQKVDTHSLRAKAEALQAKAAEKRGTKEGQEAELEEAEVLIKLTQQDRTLDLRRRILIEKLTKDRTVPADTRFRLAGTSANVEVSRNRTLDPGSRMAAYAEVAWKLVEDFPENPEGYASLLRIARDSSDELAARIADQLLVSEAPDDIKNAARLLRSRIDLLGKRFVDVVGNDITLPTQGPACLFAWSGRNPRSLGLAEILKRELPAETMIVGVCVDGDTPEARAAAAAVNLSVQWVFPTGGAKSELCQRLLLTEAAVYLVSADGRIETVSGFHWLASQRWQKAKGGRK